MIHLFPRLIVILCLLNLVSTGMLRAADERPNILWISSEDHGPQMGCYGDTYATTPNVDRLAERGLLFKHVWSCAPVCAPARTTIISGMYGPSMGAEHMRSQVPMPANTKMFPQFLRETGYYCTNNSKEDYNLNKPAGVWDESSGKAHYKNRKTDQPFFAVFNATVSHESQLRKRPHKAIHDPAKVTVPSYHPDTPQIRQDWAQYYDTVTEADAIAANTSRNLKKQAWLRTRLFFTGAITAAVCHAANDGLRILACMCRWWFTSPRNGSTWRPRNMHRELRRIAR